MTGGLCAASAAFARLGGCAASLGLAGVDMGPEDSVLRAAPLEPRARPQTGPWLCRRNLDATGSGVGQGGTRVVAGERSPWAPARDKSRFVLRAVGGHQGCLSRTSATAGFSEGRGARGCPSAGDRGSEVSNTFGFLVA